jgi:hypothetical protein
MVWADWYCGRALNHAPTLGIFPTSHIKLLPHQVPSYCHPHPHPHPQLQLQLSPPLWPFGFVQADLKSGHPIPSQDPLVVEVRALSASHQESHLGSHSAAPFRRWPLWCKNGVHTSSGSSCRQAAAHRIALLSRAEGGSTSRAPRWLAGRQSQEEARYQTLRTTVEELIRLRMQVGRTLFCAGRRPAQTPGLPRLAAQLILGNLPVDHANQVKAKVRPTGRSERPRPASSPAP